jgi:encore-like protein
MVMTNDVLMFGCADSSTEQYTDSTGVDLQQFITDTLNRNQKDRILLLKIEQELVNLAKDCK